MDHKLYIDKINKIIELSKYKPTLNNVCKIGQMLFEIKTKKEYCHIDKSFDSWLDKNGLKFKKRTAYYYMKIYIENMSKNLSELENLSYTKYVNKNKKMVVCDHDSFTINGSAIKCIILQHRRRTVKLWGVEGSRILNNSSPAALNQSFKNKKVFFKLTFKKNKE